MPRDHEGECGVFVQTGKHTPQQVSYHSIVLILTPTVVRMEVDVLLAEPVYPKEMMEHADDGIGSLPNVNCLINQVINLTWYSLTAHSIDGTLSWGKEVHRTRLEGVIRVEYLLGHVEGTLHINGN